jgi:outer membrane protein
MPPNFLQMPITFSRESDATILKYDGDGMKNRFVALMALLGVVATSAVAVSARGPSAAQNKVGVVNLQAAIANTIEGNRMFGDLQKKYEPRQQELQRLQQEIQVIQEQLSRAAELSEKEQARLSRESEEKQKLLKRSTEDVRSDFDHDRKETVNNIVQKMIHVIGDYAQQKGFTLILDGAQVPIYFISKNIDVTEDIVKRYDAVNSVGNGAAQTP